MKKKYQELMEQFEPIWLEIASLSKKRVSFWIKIGLVMIVALSIFVIYLIQNRPAREKIMVFNKSFVTAPVLKQGEIGETNPPVCFEPIDYPQAPNPGMTYADWIFDSLNINSISNRFVIYNDPGITSNLYLHLYDGEIDEGSYSVGVKTSHLVVFSQTITADVDDIRTGPNSFVEKNDEGMSLLMEYDISEGTYITRIKENKSDFNGNWLDFYIAKEGSEEKYVGGVRFSKQGRWISSIFNDKGSSWIEFLDNNDEFVLHSVPYWHVGLFLPVANEETKPVELNTKYSDMPNSDIYFDKTNNILHMKLGESTKRCNFVNNWKL